LLTAFLLHLGCHDTTKADVRHAALPLRQCIARLTAARYTGRMKTITVRLPEALVAEIEAESRVREMSKSDVVRERLQRATKARRSSTPARAIVDLIGSVEGLPTDLSARKKAYLKATGYGEKRPR
jgi:Arc/MetJ-type ribon-helix-helix transcriptional regulator